MSRNDSSALRAATPPAVPRVVGAICDQRRFVPARLWACAYLVAYKRWKSHEGKRAPVRDRGQAKNQHNDVMGAFAELLLYELVPDEHARKHVRSHLYLSKRDKELKSLPDLEVLDHNGSPVRFDVKTFDCRPEKRLFLVNAAKHAELKGRCDYYLCVIGAKNGREVYLSRPVPYGEVENWRLAHEFRDPARALPLQEFFSRYTKQRPEPERILARRFPPDEVPRRMRDLRVLDSLTRSFSSLGSLDELKTVAASLPAEWISDVL